MVELYKHNLESYIKMRDMLERKNKALLVQATSTGKSFVLMKLMQEDYDKLEKLYVVPTTSVRDNIRLYSDWEEDKVTFMTYSMLSKSDIKTILDDFDLFIFDEAHHAGAEKWGKPIKAIIESGKKCIGLTATPIRYTDGVDIGASIFDGDVVIGPDITKAIEYGLWSDFKYILTISTMSEELTRAETKLDQLPDTDDIIFAKTKLAEIRLSDLSSYTVENIVQDNLNRECNKWLVFCSNKKQLESIDQDIDAWFGYRPLKLYKLTGDTSKNYVQGVLQEFNEYSSEEPMIIASINILNEGIHPVGVNGIIMLRHTESPNIYLQQIGRGFTTNKKLCPVFVDVCDNITTLHNMVGMSSMRSKNSEGTDGDFNLLYTSKELQINVELLLSIEDFIETVKDINVVEIWSDEDIITLRRFWPDVYNRIKKPKVIINKKAVELGLKKSNVWTPEEDYLIMKLYPKQGTSMSSVLGSNRTADQVGRRARKLGIKYKGKWTYEEDIDVLSGVVPEGRSVTECNERREILKRRLL